MRRALGAGLVGFALISASAARASPPAFPDLGQGWKPAQVQQWYESSQGSRLLPLSWALALEISDGSGPFLGDAHVQRLHYLPNTNSSGQRLPVGFVVDRSPAARLNWTALHWKVTQADREPWLGLNCSACHTGQLTYGGQDYRVEGAPALSDFQGLLEDLRAALIATRDDPARFDRFARQVLKGADSKPNRDKLTAALKTLIDHELGLGRLNQTDLKYGYGRLDAFGHIYNKVAFVAAGAAALPQPSDAPVSYPFLWNVPQHDKVQWNGIAPNKAIPGVHIFDVGALGRNAGEVIGVFADIQPRSGYLKGYPSSLNVHNLSAFEQQLRALHPPAWPAGIPFADNHSALVQAGQAIFKDHCASCHAVLSRADLKTPIKAQILLFNGPTPPGTDIWMACNGYIRTAPTGVLKGTPAAFITGPAMGDEAFLSTMLTTTVAGALYERKGDLIKEAAATFFGVDRPANITAPVEAGETPKQRQARRCTTENSAILGYKARPLTGIWATAPYLHNGSVPSLYDLLLPEAQRPVTFQMGTRAFDPKRVGYVYGAAPGNDFTFDTRLPGNSNAGHNYGASVFTGTNGDALRWALVEYLKTL